MGAPGRSNLTARSNPSDQSDPTGRGADVDTLWLMPSHRASWLRLLPLLLLATMIAVGFGIEATVYGRVTWLTKLPLIAMLALAFIQGSRGRR